MRSGLAEEKKRRKKSSSTQPVIEPIKKRNESVNS